MTILFISLLL